jgi:hypothetical protein
LLTLAAELTLTAELGLVVAVSPIEPPEFTVTFPADDVCSGVVVELEMVVSAACAVMGKDAANDIGAKAAATQRRFIKLLPSPTRAPLSFDQLVFRPNPSFDPIMSA